MSSTRVMATCATVGQAVGTAASIAVRNSLSPRGVYEQKTDELKQTLMDDDCWLPWNLRSVPVIAKSAEIHSSDGDPETLRNGIDRPGDDSDNSVTLAVGGWVEYTFEKPERLREARLVFDSDLNRGIRRNRDPNVMSDTDPAAVTVKEMKCYFPLDQERLAVPESMVKSFRIETEDSGSGRQVIFHETGNYQRLVRVPLDVATVRIRVVFEETWGAENIRLFAFDIR